MSDKTVSLVLGGGGARGLAHIGVIQWLVEHDYDIQSISGCSIGALVGGLYAIDKLDEYVQWMRALTRRDIFTLLDLSWDAGGIFKGDRVFDTLKGLVGDTLIEDLPIPFTAVATNLHTGKEVWLDDGLLIDAIRASISIPLFFTPFEYRGYKLMDGGVLNPVPIAPTLGDFTDLTIAVNVSAETDHHTKHHSSKRHAEQPSVRLQNKISQFIEDLQQRASSYLSADMGLFDVAVQSFDIMQGTIARQKLAAYPPDICVQIPRDVCSILEFNRADELITIGYDTAEELINQI